MIRLKTGQDLEQMAVASRLASETLEYLKERAQPGVPTLHLDALAEEYIRARGAIPSPKGYRGYPNSICTAVNHVVVHGIPNETPLAEGDLITIDVTVYIDGFHGDKAAAIIVGGNGSAEAHRILAATEHAMYQGIACAVPGGNLGDIGASIQAYAESRGYSVVRDFCGHGIGRDFHEEPQVLHFGEHGSGRRLRPGMVFTVEPMINQGRYGVRVLEDGWTVVTKDGMLSAQFEHTIAITDNGPRVLTLYTPHERETWARFDPAHTSRD
jgi:methionyl aminopeptidase